MVEFKPIMTDNINTIPIVNGQFLVDIIGKRIYIDYNNQRNLAYGNNCYNKVQILNTSVNGQSGVIYIKPSTNQLFIWENNSYEALSLGGEPVDTYTKSEVDAIVGDLDFDD